MLIQEIKKYVPKCKIGICAYDENKENIFSFDENIIIDAACTLKVFIMLEYMKQINEKRIIGNEYLIVTEENSATGAGVVKFLSYGIRVKANDLVELMISISDHMAANMLIDFLGLNNINKTIRDFGFENTKLLKKYLVPHNKYVAKTTAYDYTNFFYMLDKNKFKYFAAEKGIPLNVLATKMGMNPATLSKKLSGFTEFTRSEIQDYQRLIGVSDAEMLSIFF